MIRVLIHAPGPPWAGGRGAIALPASHRNGFRPRFQRHNKLPQPKAVTQSELALAKQGGPPAQYPEPLNRWPRQLDKGGFCGSSGNGRNTTLRMLVRNEVRLRRNPLLRFVSAISQSLLDRSGHAAPCSWVQPFLESFNPNLGGFPSPPYPRKGQATITALRPLKMP
jgi:hypothetical protein